MTPDPDPYTLTTNAGAQTLIMTLRLDLTPACPLPAASSLYSRAPPSARAMLLGNITCKRFLSTPLLVP